MFVISKVSLMDNTFKTEKPVIIVEDVSDVEKEVTKLMNARTVNEKNKEHLEYCEFEASPIQFIAKRK